MGEKPDREIGQAPIVRANDNAIARPIITFHRYSGADVESSRRARGGSLSRFQKEANPNHAAVATRPAPDAREYSQVFSSVQPRRNLIS